MPGDTYSHSGPRYVVYGPIHSSAEPIYNAQWDIDPDLVDGGVIGDDVQLFVSNDGTNWFQATNRSTYTFATTAATNELWGMIVGLPGVSIRTQDSSTGELTPIKLKYNLGGVASMATTVVLNEWGKKVILNRSFKGTPDYLPPSQFKVGYGSGTPTTTSTDLDNPVPISGTETVDACEDTTGWSASGTNSVSQNTTSFKEGSASLNLVKSDTSSAVISVSKTTTSRDFTSKTFLAWVYIDATVYADLLATDALTLRFGSSSGDYYEYTRDKADLAAGWNSIYFTSASADSTTGSPVITACDYTYLEIETDDATDTWTAGNVMLDDVKVASSDDFYKDLKSGYPSLNETSFEAEMRARLEATEANGYLLDAFSIWNKDATNRMLSEDTFTDESKSDTDIFEFIDTWRIANLS